MSYPIATVELEQPEQFNWHHEELFSNPPYMDIDMVYMLTQGRFIIEGKPSDFSDAEMYCHHHAHSTEAWAALKAVDAGLNQTALTGPQLIY